MNIPLWTPSSTYIEQSNLRKYESWLQNSKNLIFKDYQALWQWSVDNIAEFWESIYQFFEIQSSSGVIPPYLNVLNQPSNEMIGTKWFEGVTLSYAEHIFRHKNIDRPAIIYQSETQPLTEISWKSLESKVLTIQNYLQEKGVQKGDRVVGYLPNTPDTVAIFLAVNSVGAIWSCCSPDFGVESLAERFQQIEPKILFACDSYHYGGKIFDKLSIVKELSNQLPSLIDTIIVDSTAWELIVSAKPKQKLNFTAVEFNDPIWILYSSGTTGKPKAITHSTGGNLIEHLKALALHQDVQVGERYFWYSTTGWMMWNFALSSLACGATLCLYDGSPGYPDINILWQFAKEAKVDHFGCGAAFYINYMKQDTNFFKGNLLKIKTLGSTGSPLPSKAFEWIYKHISTNVHLISLSGGTDVCSAFMGGCPYLPVYSGEIQCRMLGADIEALNDEGKPVYGEVGELVIKEVMPSMPLYFWKDVENQKYRSSYFEKYTGVWTHGDWIKITQNLGVIIYGRSDTTLNRDGVRIGTAEVYNAIESLPEIKDSLIVCIEKTDGSFFMPLYVVLHEDQELNEELKSKIKAQLRIQYSPRHVPDAIFEVPEIPYTISGKKMEMPIKKILMGTSVVKAVSLDAMRNPQSIDWFVNQNIN
ncbi:acetoacetate--CoA ligase [Emticicia sp. BO119]|uniref:acetoacetate--CoA ligase n=1 Tax=Emticicia sp. BO119 TaxID=2757768 RepID=UPI0015F0A8A6|nr:acetoacetate--CoA ligase [Emticicia sp. BO119]MBA4853269.1 acetoacetate--CoA ligase [Emticicia sp. BO119]